MTDQEHDRCVESAMLKTNAILCPLIAIATLLVLPTNLSHEHRALALLVALIATILLTLTIGRIAIAFYRSSAP